MKSFKLRCLDTLIETKIGNEDFYEVTQSSYLVLPSWQTQNQLPGWA